jgi:glycosyltransferase involved in cell wall biosynthesis
MTLNTVAWKLASRMALAASKLPDPLYARLLAYVIQPLLELMAGKSLRPERTHPTESGKEGSRPVPSSSPAAPVVRTSPGPQMAPRVPAGPAELRPRVLVIDGFVPTPDKDSASNDVYWFMRIMLDLGYEVTFVPAFATADAGRYTDDLRRLGIICPAAPELTSARDFVAQRGGAFALVALYRISVAKELFDAVRQFAPRAKVIFNTVDLHFLREQRAAELNGSLREFVEAKRREKIELRVIRAADAAILLSDFEYDLIGRLVPDGRRFFLPIVRPVPGRLAPYEGRSGALFVGGFSHAPNVDAVEFLCDAIWPLIRGLLPAAKLVIVGADAPEGVMARHSPSDGVEVLGHVEDLTALYRSARVTVAPLRFGAGLKGKVIASLAVGIPCVVTSIAGEGMPRGGSDAMLVADSPRDFAEAVARIYSDEALWYRISDAGVTYARDNFSVETISGKLRDLLDRLDLPHGDRIARGVH